MFLSHFFEYVRKLKMQVVQEINRSTKVVQQDITLKAALKSGA